MTEAAGSRDTANHAVRTIQNRHVFVEQASDLSRYVGPAEGAFGFESLPEDRGLPGLAGRHVLQPSVFSFQNEWPSTCLEVVAIPRQDDVARQSRLERAMAHSRRQNRTSGEAHQIVRVR